MYEHRCVALTFCALSQQYSSSRTSLGTALDQRAFQNFVSSGSAAV